MKWQKIVETLSLQGLTDGVLVAILKQVVNKFVTFELARTTRVSENLAGR